MTQREHATIANRLQTRELQLYQGWTGRLRSEPVHRTLEKPFIARIDASHTKWQATNGHNVSTDIILPEILKREKSPGV